MVDEPRAGDQIESEIIILKADISDAPEILALQKISYLSEAEIYRDFTIPPLVQTLGEIEGEFTDHLFLKAVSGDRIVGSVRARENAGTCFIGRLIVSPSFRGQGIGKRLMAGIEREFSSASRYELFTGHRSVNNLALYKRLGYLVFKIEPVSDVLTFVFLEKYARKAG